MDFALNETQQEIVALVDKILGDVCSEDKLKALEAVHRFDAKLWQTLRDAGLLSLTLNEAAGGMGLGLFEICLVAEQMGKHTAPVPFAYHELALAYLQKAMPTVLESTMPSLCTLIVSERPTLNRLRFDGSCCHGDIDCVPYARWADYALLVAHDNDGLPVLLLLQMDQRGVKLLDQAVTSGEPNSRIELDHAEVIQVGDAAATTILQQQMAVLICAMQLGNLEKALSMTTAYTCEREQFGVPIGSFQAVSHRVADAYMLIVNLRNTTHDACCELTSGGDSSLPVLVAKYWCGEAGHAGMATFQHAHGGMGADRDYGLWRHTVWSKQFEMQLGSSSEMIWQLGEALAGPA